MEYHERIAELAKRWLDGSITPAEEEEFSDWYNHYPDDVVELAPGFAGSVDELKQRSFALLEEKIGAGKEKNVRDLRWVRYAAAAILIFIVGAYLWNYTQKERPSRAAPDPYAVKNDVLPGGDRAVLTLSNGKQVMLDDAANGVLATEGNAKVIKQKSGQIVYSTASGIRNKEVLYNTMSTPRGGQYQLTLPDGSRVWLNAMSSITYPVLFSAKTRNVSITGEAYFEVEKNPAQPFIVKTRAESITVLGTHFNIRAYENEGPVKTSLLEGSVKVADQILKPGQAFVNGKIVTTSVDQDVAWKNGYFNFNGADLQVVMQQLERWYDIEVVYKGQSSPGKYQFHGEMQRSLRLSQVIRILNAMEIQFNIEGKKLIVTQ